MNAVKQFGRLPMAWRGIMDKKLNLCVRSLLGLAFLVVMLETAEAQFPFRNPYQNSGSVYTPASSPLPIYLQYFRTDVGVTDPYNNFVRPRQELQRTLQAQQTRINYLQAEQQTLMQDQQQGRSIQIAPTGTSSQFFNYSHYFPGLRGQ